MKCKPVLAGAYDYENKGTEPRSPSIPPPHAKDLRGSGYLGTIIGTDRAFTDRTLHFYVSNRKQACRQLMSRLCLFYESVRPLKGGRSARLESDVQSADILFLDYIC